MRQILREIVSCPCSSVNDDSIKCMISRLSSECSYRYGSLRCSLYFWSKFWWLYTLKQYRSLIWSWNRSLWLRYVQKSTMPTHAQWISWWGHWSYSCPQHYHHIKDTARPWRYACITYSGAGEGYVTLTVKVNVLKWSYCLNVGECANGGYQALFPSPALIRAWVRAPMRAFSLHCQLLPCCHCLEFSQLLTMEYPSYSTLPLSSAAMGMGMFQNSALKNLCYRTRPLEVRAIVYHAQLLFRVIRARIIGAQIVDGHIGWLWRVLAVVKPWFYPFCPRFDSDSVIPQLILYL